MSAADAAAAPMWIGGRYELVERLGQGTTCEVHLARTVRRDGEVSLVALRRPLPTFGEDPRFVEELLASARRASQLLHPGIARVLDVSADPRTPFVATEYVHGEQLAAVLRRLVPGQRPLDVLLRVIGQAAEAVEHAHAARTPLVHGSITPQNLFVAYDGEVRVADFGTPRPSIGPDDVHSRDHAGIAYWSPEQAAQRMFEAPADVFALGVILWECITQRRLFVAPTRAETRALVKRCEVPRPGDMTDCPAALERLVMRCLARDPHERFTSAGVLADEITDLLEKRRRDASPEAIRRLMQDLFAQRKTGRDATLRRAMHPSRESYAPLAAASPSILPSALAGVVSTHPATPPLGAETRPRATQTEESGLRPAQSSSTTTSTTPSTTTTSTTTTEPDAPPVFEPPVVPIVEPATATVARSTPTRQRPAPSMAAWGGFVAIGLGLMAVLGVLSQVLTTPRVEAPPPSEHVPSVPRAERVGPTPPERAEPSVEPVRAPEPAAEHEAPPALAEAVGDVAPVVPEEEPSDPEALEDPSEEPATEAAVFPTLDDDHGTLEILCRPAAEIFVDNRSLGLTPRIVDVPEGPIAIGLRSTGPGHPWRTLRRTVERRGTVSIPMSECP